MAPSSKPWCIAISIRCWQALPQPRCLLLGCTHYPALKAVIARVAGPDVTLVDSAETTATAIQKLLTAENLVAPPGASAFRKFLATDASDRFARVGEIFLGAPIDPGTVELIDLQ